MCKRPWTGIHKQITEKRCEQVVAAAKAEELTALAKRFPSCPWRLKGAMIRSPNANSNTLCLDRRHKVSLVECSGVYKNHSSKNSFHFQKFIQRKQLKVV